MFEDERQAYKKEHWFQFFSYCVHDKTFSRQTVPYVRVYFTWFSNKYFVKYGTKVIPHHCDPSSINKSNNFSTCNPETFDFNMSNNSSFGKFNSSSTVSYMTQVPKSRRTPAQSNPITPSLTSRINPALTNPTTQESVSLFDYVTWTEVKGLKEASSFLQ